MGRGAGGRGTGGVAQIPEQIGAAVRRAVTMFRADGQSGIDWVYNNVLSADDKRAFDAYLVGSRHPLAYEPGTNWQRFNAFVREEAG